MARIIGRFLNLATGQEVNIHRSTRGSFYLVRGKQHFVEPYGGDWFQLDQPRRGTRHCDRRDTDVHGYAEVFYDRAIRLWTCLWLDDNGDQIGTAEYDASKQGIYRLIRTNTSPYKPAPAAEEIQP